MISEKLSRDYLCVKRRINQVESDKHEFNAYPKGQYSSFVLKFVSFRAILDTICTVFHIMPDYIFTFRK
jgi:hypothetical protein